MIALYIIAAKYSEFIKKQSGCNIFINTANKELSAYQIRNLHYLKIFLDIFSDRFF